MRSPVVCGVANVLAHAPDLVPYGSKPRREITRDPEVLPALERNLRSFQAAVGYAPNQVYLGVLHPDRLHGIPTPWYRHLVADAQRLTPFGEIISCPELLCWLKVADMFGLVSLSAAFVASHRPTFAASPVVTDGDLERLGTGADPDVVAAQVNQGALPLRLGGQLVGAVRAGHDEDDNLTAPIILENLCCKATGVLALRHLFRQTVAQGVTPADVDYLIGCGEEASGDRYQRGGGSMAKAMAEQCGCAGATGSDLKAYCCAPIHALTTAAGLVAAGLYRYVAVVGGGCLSKLGMKFRGHLTAGMPVLEDVLAGTAVLVGPDDGRSPRLDLSVVGRHPIAAGGAQQAITQSLVVEPLERAGLRLTDVDRYAVELHNPEVTVPAGSGDVPLNNYRMIAAIAVHRREIRRGEMDAFVRSRGMPGFSPTQGHIAAAIPYLPHAVTGLRQGDLERALFVAKGSLFLGKMTQISDGMSVLLTANRK